MKNKILKLISVIVILGVITSTTLFLMHASKEDIDKGKSADNENIDIITSLEDVIGENAAWCGTFNLIWNDLKNDLAKKDIEFAVELESVNNLNKSTFTTKDISEESYYKTYGKPNLELKEKIERSIKEKFNEKSAILDSFDWGNHSELDYFLYAMLKKEFEYPKTFDKLDNGVFENYNNVRYFGIDNGTKKQVREQVNVLYYNSENDFAFKIKTKGNDEIIVSVGNKENNFMDIYNSIIAYSDNFNGNRSLANNDTLKMPYISFNLNKIIEDVMNKPFTFSDGTLYEITKALQTIEFELDEKGGRIKSEAGMMVDNAMVAMPEEPRKFNVDQTFTLFLKEDKKELPYFATKITDISTVQGNVTANEDCEVNENDNNEKIETFIATIVEEYQSYLIVTPNEDEKERKSSDKIEVGLGITERDYLYGVGRKVIISYDGSIMETYPARIKAIDIDVDGYADFQLNIEKSKDYTKKKILNTKELNEFNVEYSLYYCGIDEIYVKVDNKEMTLEDALRNGYLTIEGIISKANKETDEPLIYKDGGSKEYRYKDYKIIKFHTINGNRDVYFCDIDTSINDL